MSASTVEKEIINIIAEVADCEKEVIGPETNIVKDLEVDSIRAIEITVAIEKKYKIKVRDEDVPKIVTVHQAVELVNRLIAAGASNAKT